MGIQWYLKQFRKDIIGRFLQEIRCQHRVAPRFLLVRGNSRAATSRPRSSGAMSPLIGVFTPNQEMFEEFLLPKKQVQPNSSHSSWTYKNTLRLFPCVFFFSGDRSMRQVLRTSIWSGGPSHGRDEHDENAFFFYVEIYSIYIHILWVCVCVYIYMWIVHGKIIKKGLVSTYHRFIRMKVLANFEVNRSPHDVLTDLRLRPDRCSFGEVQMTNFEKNDDYPAGFLGFLPVPHAFKQNPDHCSTVLGWFSPISRINWFCQRFLNLEIPRITIMFHIKLAILGYTPLK